MIVNDWIEIGIGDSRTPDEIKSGVSCMHTNSMLTYIKFDGVWCVSNIRSALYLKSLFDYCKTRDDCAYVINELINDRDISNPTYW